MKTTKTPQKKEIQRNWYLINAEGQILGRLASKISQILLGKNKPNFCYNLDTGDYVVVINASKIKVTGDKLKKKMYYRHSGYLGGLKEESMEELLKKDPRKVLEKAVWGMLPSNKLGRAIFKKLKVYPGSEHKHQAQKLEKLEL